MTKPAALFGLALLLSLFAPAAAAHITLNAPNGGQVYTVGDSVTVEWVITIAHNTENWDIYYSTTGVAPWTLWVEDLPPGDISLNAVHSYTGTIIPGMVSPTMRIRAAMDNFSGTDYYDKSDGDITVLPGAWVDLGAALSGTAGDASLTGSGPLTSGSLNALDLDNAVPSATAILFVGLAAGNAPFKGGTLVPFPALLSVTLPTNGSGAVSLPFVWPAGIGAGTDFFFQYWFADAGGPVGAAASNAVKGTAG